MFNKFVAALLALSFSGTAYAADAVTFSKTSAELNSPVMGIAYFTALSNTDDEITGVTSDCCTAVELHKNDMKDGVMRMRKVDTLALEANVATEVQHGAADGYHVMLIGPKAGIKAINLTFDLKHAGKQTVAFPLKAAAKAADHGAHH